VGTVLEGSVRKAGAQLRITAQLVNVGDGYHLWSERFDREPEDVFAIQEEIARTIAERLQVSLAGSDQMTLVRPHTENLEAYQLYLKGRGFINRRGVALWQALEAFRAAFELDPQYALASAGLADAYTLLGMYGVLSPRDALPHARAAARRSVELGPSSPRPTMPWRACGCGIGTGPAPTGSSARHWSSTRATCKPAAGTGCSTCSGCTAGMRRGLRRRRARSK